MPVITLISDRSTEDFFLGKLKGRILSMCNDIHIIDLAHKIEHYSVSNAAFILKNSWRDFPAGTVHIIAVDCACNNTQKHLIAEIQGQYFITSDNGLLSLAFDDSDLQKIVKLKLCDNNSAIMPAIFSFAETACEIIKGKRIESFGEFCTNIKKRLLVQPISDDNFILGSMIYADSFGNAVSNISFDLFNEVSKGRSCIIYPGTLPEPIRQISVHYNDVEEGETMAFFNSLGFLEIAMNKGNVTELMNFNKTTKIRVEFYD